MMAPPQFKLEASEAQNSHSKVEQSGSDTVQAIAAKEYAGKDWQRIWEILESAGLGAQLLDVCDHIFHSGQWVMDPKAKRLGILDAFEYGVAGQKETQTGYVEVVEMDGKAGIRAIVPYGSAKGAHGGDVILHPHKTTTVLGRFIDVAAHNGDTQAAVDAESGTNYFRFQENFKVGENKGGGNVLSIEDFSWGKNNAWLQAAVERGDIIRFVSDPTDLAHLVYNKVDLEGGLTITGQELGVLLNLGLAPDPRTDIVVPLSEIPQDLIPAIWFEIRRFVKSGKILDDLDADAKEKRFAAKGAEPSRKPEVRKDRDTKEVIAEQTNFFNRNSKSKE